MHEIYIRIFSPAGFLREHWIISQRQIKSDFRYRARSYLRNSEFPLSKSLYARLYFLADRAYIFRLAQQISVAVLSYDGYNRPASIIKSSYSYMPSHDVSISILHTYVRIQRCGYVCMCVHVSAGRKTLYKSRF